MKFDDVTVRISNKDENCPVGQFYGLGDWNLTGGQLLLNGFKIINLKCNMGKSRVFFRQVHQDIARRGIGCRIEDEINVDARWV